MNNAPWVGLRIADYLARTGHVNKWFGQAAGASTVLLDPVGLLTDPTGLCRAELDGKALYFDQHHLSIFWEVQLQPMFESIFRGGALASGLALN